MANDGIEQVLWLCGPDAVGKTSVAWELYQDVARRGIPVAHLDTDQLGFCEPVAEAGPQELVAANLTAMAANFAAAGARCLVVSGIMYSPVQRAFFEAALPGARFTVCRLTAAGDTVRQRILRRGRIEGAGGDGAVTGLSLDGLAEYGDRAAGFAERMDATTFADLVVATDRVPVVEVARRVIAATGGWPGPEVIG